MTGLFLRCVPTVTLVSKVKFVLEYPNAEESQTEDSSTFNILQYVPRVLYPRRLMGTQALTGLLDMMP
ncbi:uncharacterized protein N7487_012278 [Penicillium crustosum]|uniref:uncharacterized protein n=1 Tax=Penicillium crustosum TaxID=36656 RepID=UPI00238395DF|nr:uncharacterized protein N7487_012278 [Penicillium crustosum]KAJ5394637.1 hypothetical protein N7487_012278 [Penicillium crustosum]